MNLSVSLWTAGVLLAVMLLAGFLNYRRGISAWALVPWDYLFLFAAFLLVLTLGHIVKIWPES